MLCRCVRSKRYLKTKIMIITSEIDAALLAGLQHLFCKSTFTICAGVKNIVALLEL